MRATTLMPLLALAVLVAGACHDSTAPRGQATDEDVAALMDVMLGAGLAGPAEAGRGSGSHACVDGGTVSGEGETTVSDGMIRSRSTVTFDECGARTPAGERYRVDGRFTTSIQAALEAPVEGPRVEGAVNGRLAWSSADGSGSCDVELSIAGGDGSARLTGRVCGLPVERTVSSLGPLG